MDPTGLKRFKSGDNLLDIVTANNANGWQAASEDLVRRAGGDLGQPTPGGQVAAGRVSVVNLTGSNLPIGSIVGLGGLANAPGTNTTSAAMTPSLASFLAGPVFNAETPNTVTHAGRVAVVSAPMLPGAVGEAIVAGPAVVRVSVASTNDRTASVVSGQTGQLTSSASGSIPLLYAAPATGTQWGVVNLGAGGSGGGGGPSYFRLSQTGGVAGTNNATCSFTYNVYNFSDASLTSPLATSVAVTGSGNRIPNITYASASYGGGLATGGTVTTNNPSGLVLLWTDERPATPGTC